MCILILRCEAKMQYRKILFLLFSFFEETKTIVSVIKKMVKIKMCILILTYEAKIQYRKISFLLFSLLEVTYFIAWMSHFIRYFKLPIYKLGYTFHFINIYNLKLHYQIACLYAC